MEKLPVEIIENIIYQLQIALLEAVEHEHTPLFWRPRLAPYSTVSRSFQHAIERETFKNLQVDSEFTVDDLKYVVANGVGRAAAVRKIYYTLYHHHETSAMYHVRLHLKIKNDLSFSKGLRKLLNVIDSWYALDGKAGDIELRLWPIGNRKRFDTKELPSGPEPMDELQEQQMTLRRYPMYLDMRGLQFPALQYISAFSVVENHKIGPASLINLMSGMPNLQRFEGCFDDSERDDIRIRQNYRKELGENLCRLPRSLKSFQAKFGCEMEYSTCASDSSLMPQNALYDPKMDNLCLGLFFLSQRLERLAIEQICISPTLLWFEHEHVVNTWLNLEEIQVIYEPVTADGQWLTDIDPNAVHSDVDDSDESGAGSVHWLDFRGIINRSLVNPFFINAAKAVHHMPSLRSMELSLNRWAQSTLEFHFTWSAENKRYEVLWVTNSTFELDDAVIDAWGIDREDIVIDDWNKKYPGTRDIRAPIKWKPGDSRTELPQERDLKPRQREREM